LIERRRVGEVVPLVVRNRERKILTRLAGGGPGCLGRLDPHADAPADEAHARVAEQRAWQEVGFGEDLEAVADA
jgi:hypothetical protein